VAVTCTNVLSRAGVSEPKLISLRNAARITPSDGQGGNNLFGGVRVRGIPDYLCRVRGTLSREPDGTTSCFHSESWSTTCGPRVVDPRHAGGMHAGDLSCDTITDRPDGSDLTSKLASRSRTVNLCGPAVVQIRFSVPKMLLNDV
jgi:hypothetical protein